MTTKARSFWQSNLFQATVAIMLALIGAVFAYGQLTNQQSVTSKEVFDLKTKMDIRISEQNNKIEEQRDLMQEQIKEIAVNDVKQTAEITYLKDSIDEAFRGQTLLLEKLNDRIDESRRENSDSRRELREDIKALRQSITRIVDHQGD